MNGEWIPIERAPGGDEERLILVWHAFLQCWTDRAYNYRNNMFYTHWKEAPKKGWIRTEDRVPIEADGDVMHCVLAANDDLSILRVTGWHQVRRDSPYTRWMPTPGGPPQYKELMKLY